MEGKEEDVRLGANKYSERQSIGTVAQIGDKDYKEPPLEPLFELGDLTSWSFYRAGIVEFMAMFLFLSAKRSEFKASLGLSVEHKCPTMKEVTEKINKFEGKPR